MATYVIKRDIVWLESLKAGDQGDTIVLLGKNGCKIEVPAVVLLAVSPLVRSILSGSLLSFFPPVVTLPIATEDTLKIISDILTTGTAAGITPKNLSNLQDIFKILGVLGSLISGPSMSTVVRDVPGFSVDCGIKIEVDIKVEEKSDEEDVMESSTENNKSEANPSCAPTIKKAKLDNFSCHDAEKSVGAGLGKQKNWQWDRLNNTRKKMFPSNSANQESRIQSLGTNFVTIKDGQLTVEGPDHASAAVMCKQISSGQAKLGDILGIATPQSQADPSPPEPSPSPSKNNESGLVNRMSVYKLWYYQNAKNVQGQIDGGRISAQKIFISKDGKIIGHRKVAIPSLASKAAPAVESATATLQKVQIVKSKDGKIRARGLLPGQQLVLLPDGKFKIFSGQKNCSSSS